MRAELVHRLDADSIVLVLVPVGLLFHDVEVYITGQAAEGFQQHHCLCAEVGSGGIVERLLCFAEELVFVGSGVQHEAHSDGKWEGSG